MVGLVRDTPSERGPSVDSSLAEAVRPGRIRESLSDRYEARLLNSGGRVRYLTSLGVERQSFGRWVNPLSGKEPSPLAHPD